MAMHTRAKWQWRAGLIVLAAAPVAEAAGGPQRQRDVTGTWLDAFNFLDLIPGPEFLLLFILYTVLVILLIRVLVDLWRSRIEGASLLDLGEKMRFELKPTYLELAYLQGGRKAVVEAALCNLHRMGIVSVSLAKDRMIRNPVVLARLHGVERAVAAACEDGLAAFQLESSFKVSHALGRFEDEVQPKLRRIGLLAARPTYLAGLTGAGAAVAIVDGLGLIRLMRSLMRGYSNVGILVILMLVAAGAIAWTFKMRLTRAGSRYVGEMRVEYQQLARRVQAKMHAWDEPDVLYVVAACGSAALGGTGYAAIHEALKPPRSAGDSCGGCGGGGCGGGGCGGGGCGGGGCGGG